ncbi:hypothetical protein [Moraxella oculi]|uniref:SH3 domain protein n=1 Tax=Moraxella oculi TaxID=2940516 RepID=A0ABW8U8C5_9GAMM
MKKHTASFFLLTCLSVASSAFANTPAPITEKTAAFTNQTIITNPADAQSDGQHSSQFQHDALSISEDAHTPSIEEIAAPKDNALSLANAELLVKNAELERRINDLTTQVNVLTNERSGQLFLYGAITVLVTIGLCVLAGTLISMRNQRSRW